MCEESRSGDGEWPRGECGTVDRCTDEWLEIVFYPFSIAFSR